MVGFFLPGDTLLLSAGVLAAQGQFPIELTVALIALAAILGDNTGYFIGRTMGKRLFRKKDGILFRQEYVARTERFYEKHGAKTMMIAHFLPIVRSFAPLVAGVGKMPRAKFVFFDAIGDVAWAGIVTLLGYWFGSRIPNLDRYILPVVVAVMIISFGPMVWHIVGNRETRRRMRDRLATLLRRQAKKIDPDKDN
jgi:membrane-associated protein